MSKTNIFVASFISTFVSFGSFSHQGGLNSEGCHNNKKTETYHCHKHNPDRREDGFRVVDGDTIHFDFDKVKVRFSGIDTPETNQICYQDDSPVRCGQIATEKLKEFIGDSLPVCKSEGEDIYGRVIAECFVNGESISKYLVRNGYAFAYREYSKKFIQDENYAKKNQLGFWNMEFEFPWDFRKK